MLASTQVHSQVGNGIGFFQVQAGLEQLLWVQLNYANQSSN